MELGGARKIEKITFFTYGFTYARHGDPGIVNWPWGAVLGARWPFLIPAQRHFVQDRRPNGPSEAPNEVGNYFWSFFCAKEVFGVCLELSHGTSGKSKKLLFSPMVSPEVATGTPGSSNRPGAQF